MTATTSIPADLLTPLGAYLRLRSAGGGSFLLESVERGRLGRNSFVGRGARIVGLAEAEELGLPVVGYVSYDWAATLEPTVPLPTDGAGLAESAFVVVETLVGDPDEIAARLAAPLVEPTKRAGERGELTRSPTQERYEEMVRVCQEYIRAGDAYQVVPSQRAERPTSALRAAKSTMRSRMRSAALTLFSISHASPAPRSRWPAPPRF